MNKYKMLCLDIDGTLFNSMHKISKETKEKINAAANQGVIVVLVSARMPKGIVYLQEECSFDNIDIIITDEKHSKAFLQIIHDENIELIII